MRRIIFSFLFFYSLIAAGQKSRKEDKQILMNLQTHVRYLASDQLQGRMTGSAGERLAAANRTYSFSRKPQ